MKERLCKNNKGYSLVELIIVIAIILLMATGALLSYTVVHSARAKEGAVKLGSEINELKTRCMNMTPEDSDYDYYALAVYNDSKSVTHIGLVMHKKSSGAYDYVPDEEDSLSSSVRVKFIGSYLQGGTGSSLTTSASEVTPGSKGGTGDDSPIYICFDKRGNCYSGYGDFKFYKKNGNQVSRVNLKQNGGIDVR